MQLDVSEELSTGQAAYYQSLIGILRWMGELGRIDICCKVPMLSHMVLPLKGHLELVFHLFGYLKNKHNSQIVFDPSYPLIKYSDFCEENWESAYGKLEEEIPDNVPKNRGKGFIVETYVGADHVGHKVIWRSRTRCLIVLNMAPTYWLPKKQTGVETSLFGFVVLKQCTEYVQGLQYK